MAASPYQPLQGSNLTDASVTKNPASDGVNEYVLPAATLTTNRVLTLGTTGSPSTNDVVRVVRADLTAHTYAVANGGGGGGTLYTFAASPTVVQGASFYYDGTNWHLLSVYNLDYLTVHTSSPISGDGSVGSPITVIGGVNPLRIGAALGDTSPTVNPGSDLVSEYQLPAATLTANQTVTLGITGSPTTSLTVAIVRKDLTAFTLAIVNGGGGGGTMFTFASSPAGVQCATFTFDGTNWNFVNFYYLAL